MNPVSLTHGLAQAREADIARSAIGASLLDRPAHRAGSVRAGARRVRAQVARAYRSALTPSSASCSPAPCCA